MTPNGHVTQQPQAGLAVEAGRKSMRSSLLLHLLMLSLWTLTACSQNVSLSLQYANLAAIPGSQRSLYATVDGTRNLAVRWSATGGCTLASKETEGAPQIVTAPAKGAACRINSSMPTKTAPSFASNVSCTITAASVADPRKSDSIVLPVCAPDVMLTVFPQSTVLYRTQYAVLQSDLRGSVNTDVRWEITQNPGRAGVLTGGSANRHAIFSASAAGTYVLTATSVADPSRKATSVIHVTPHDLPAAPTDHTEAVDCTAVGGGATYDVGPLHRLKSLNAVAWAALRPGDTVRVFNDDTTGAAPTEYHQHVTLSASGAEGRPIRICGVPDKRGVKAIIDGKDFSTTSGKSAGATAMESVGLFFIVDNAHRAADARLQNKFIVVEGLHFRNANPEVTFLRGITRVPYGGFAHCVYVLTGRDVMIRGNEMEGCAGGIFAGAGTPEGSLVTDMTVQGNALLRWGVPGNETTHGMYLQAIGLQVQFNYFGAPHAGANGNVLKSRSVLQFLRWNYIGQLDSSVARAFDLPEPQEFICYVAPYAFAVAYRGSNPVCGAPRGGAAADPYTADRVAANNEAYHSDYIYGNTIDDAGSRSSTVHYAYDQGEPQAAAEYRRGGTLSYWNNSLLLHQGEYKTLFDPSQPDMNPSSEYPEIRSINSVFAAGAGASFQWTRPMWERLSVDSNWMAANAILPNRLTRFHPQLPPSLTSSCKSDGMCRQSNGRMTWLRGGRAGSMSDTLYVGQTPFDSHTFLPESSIKGLGVPLPADIRNQPSNMEYLPTSNEIRPRMTQQTLGAIE